jgi:quinol monooxygenase YgiN
MLFLHEKLTATPSRQQDVVERVGAIHSYMQKHPGFVVARVARYLGNPNEYLVMRWWQSADALADHQRNPVVPNWGANRPEGIYLEPPKTTRWESAAESGQPWSGFFVRTIYKPRAIGSPDLLDTLSRHAEEGTRQGGMSGAEVFRSLDEADFAGAVLVLAGFKDRDAFNLYLKGAEAADLATPNEGFEAVMTGCFEVVEQALPEAAKSRND